MSGRAIAPWFGVARTERAEGRAAGYARLCLLLFTCALASCATPKILCLDPSGLKQISISSSVDSNGGRPIAVDLVYVTHKTILQALAHMTARDYFANKSQLAQDFPDGLTTRSWELEAGQFVLPTATEPPCNLAGTLIFANFAAEGDHRISLRKERAGNIQLGPDGFVWSPK